MNYHWFFAVLSGMQRFRSGDDPRGLKELSQGQTSLRVPPLDPSPNVSRPLLRQGFRLR